MPDGKNTPARDVEQPEAQAPVDVEQTPATPPVGEQPSPQVTDPGAQSAVDAEEARRLEYGRYVAAHNIFVGGALAFRAGDPVPVSHVENGVVELDAVTTKES